MIDAGKREEVGAIELPGASTGAVAFTPDGKRGFTPVGAGGLAVFDVPEPAPPLPKLKFTRP
jgi:hypothetical protein